MRTNCLAAVQAISTISAAQGPQRQGFPPSGDWGARVQISPLRASNQTLSMRRPCCPLTQARSNAMCVTFCPIAASAFLLRDGLRRNRQRRMQARPTPSKSLLRPCGGTYMPANSCEVLNVTRDAGSERSEPVARISAIAIAASSSPSARTPSRA